MTTMSVPPRIQISAETARAAREVPQLPSASLVLHLADGRQVELPAGVQKMLLEALSAVATVGAVNIARMPEEMTSSVAADVLGVSRPTLLRWAREGEIDSFRVGSHTRFRRSDVLALRERREQQRAAAFQALRDLDAGDDVDLGTE